MLASKVPRSSPDKTLAENNGDSKDPSGFIFKPAENWSLISQGAEARIWKIPNFQTHLEQLNIYKRKKNSSSNNGCHQREKDGREGEGMRVVLLGFFNGFGFRIGHMRRYEIIQKQSKYVKPIRNETN